jgi:5'-phosphate synthase pdxT subunit
MAVGLLGLQGAFRDHVRPLERLGRSWRVVRDRKDLAAVDRLILPGGESTVMAKFLVAFGMDGMLTDRIRAGMPVWGICAGAILMAATVDGRSGLLGVLPMAVARNAYGRQLASCEQPVAISAWGQRRFPAVFIRAPRIVSVSPEVSVHAVRGGDPVFVQCGTAMATTFHPELTDRLAIHRHFLALPAAQRGSSQNHCNSQAKMVS